MILMRSSGASFVLSVASVVLALSCLLPVASAADKPETLKGQVSETMCGAKHPMPDAAACTRACVKKGSDYALVVGEKIYTLKTTDKAALDQLDKLAGQDASVTGTVKGETVEVSSVKPGA
jgi:hypothetical protein